MALYSRNSLIQHLSKILDQRLVEIENWTTTRVRESPLVWKSRNKCMCRSHVTLTEKIDVKCRIERTSTPLKTPARGLAPPLPSRCPIAFWEANRKYRPQPSKMAASCHINMDVANTFSQLVTESPCQEHLQVLKTFTTALRDKQFRCVNCVIYFFFFLLSMRSRMMACRNGLLLQFEVLNIAIVFTWRFL